MANDAVSPEFRGVLRFLRLGPMRETLPERVALARQNEMSHLDFLEVVLTDEMERRKRLSAEMRSRRGNLDPEMVLERWDSTSKVQFDRQLWAELLTLRFLETKHHVLILGPVGVGKTFLATTLGHVACRRGHAVHMVRADKMLKELKAARLDRTHEAEMRRLIRSELLIVDDLGLERFDEEASRDLYEIIVERHRAGSMIVTSNREPAEWIGLMSDPLRAQSAIDRLQNGAFELVIEGESYRKRQRPQRSEGRR